MTTSTMITFHGIEFERYLQLLSEEICGKKDVDVDEIIEDFCNINISGDPKTVENTFEDRIKTDPVSSALSYILAVSLHRRNGETKPRAAAYCFHKIFKAIHEFQHDMEHRKLLKNGATTDSVTDILIRLMLQMYKLEFKEIQEEEDKHLRNIAAIGYAATWITETCCSHPRWKKEADEFYKIGKRFEEATTNFEDQARLYNSRAKYLATNKAPQETVNHFFKLAEDTVEKMDESKSEKKSRLLYFIKKSRKECAGQ